MSDPGLEVDCSTPEQQAEADAEALQAVLTAQKVARALLVSQAVEALALYPGMELVLAALGLTLS